MLAEEFFTSICGPPLSSNTAIAKDVGIYTHSLWPTFAAKSAFKKSATPPNCLAASKTHVFAAQHEKAYVHVYSRLRGNQEAFVAFPERIRCLTLAGDVLILGTVEGRVMLWETCTGRLVSLPPCHVQAVSCVVATPYHLLTGSDDSNIHVWSLAQLLELDSNEEREPVVSFSNHRGAITAIAPSSGDSEDTSICVSASKDKTCIIWNYRTGAVLRTLLFPTFPLCVALDPCSRGAFVSTEGGPIFSIEFFGPKPLLGPKSEESSTVVQVTAPFCVAPSDSGPASCLGLTNGAKELTNLNAAVTNIILDPPLSRGSRPTKAWNVVKPSQVQHAYTFTAQFEADLRSETQFHAKLKTPGFSNETLENAISAFLQPEDGKASDEISPFGASKRLAIGNQSPGTLAQTCSIGRMRLKITHKLAHAAETGLSVPLRLTVVADEPSSAVCNVVVPELFDVPVPDTVIAVADGLIPSTVDHMMAGVVSLAITGFDTGSL
ncbi:WD domain-containing protein [Diaporthe amygdali]|uniref:WD domain-containing protein n=1 Tax=Phomopsis amygdali TaxID=1214568 RepID=UPI0022FDDAE2|nr:WD domain-containing protein [Diaporthe amygdali]KAJ0123602.1 WD domain-containing protein [Diaporthe amygdali]